jgi:hypothetical protein
MPRLARLLRGVDVRWEMCVREVGRRACAPCRCRRALSKNVCANAMRRPPSLLRDACHDSLALALVGQGIKPADLCDLHIRHGPPCRARTSGGGSERHRDERKVSDGIATSARPAATGNGTAASRRSASAARERSASNIDGAMRIPSIRPRLRSATTPGVDLAKDATLLVVEGAVRDLDGQGGTRAAIRRSKRVATYVATPRTMRSPNGIDGYMPAETQPG